MVVIMTSFFCLKKDMKVAA